MELYIRIRIIVTSLLILHRLDHTHGFLLNVGIAFTHKYNNDLCTAIICRNCV